MVFALPNERPQPLLPGDVLGSARGPRLTAGMANGVARGRDTLTGLGAFRLDDTLSAQT
jgi:hypothetical protein